MGIRNKNIINKTMVKCGLMMILILGLFVTSLPKVSAAADDRDPKKWLQYLVNIGGAYMDQYFSMVHFNVAGNDFGGGLLWLPVEQLSGDVVEVSIPKSDGTDCEDNPSDCDFVYCSSKVRGFYWNSQRGDNRLWPLDDVTHKWLKVANPDAEKYAGLELTGGWYTTCSEDRSTAELNNYIEDNAIPISLSKLEEIVDSIEAQYGKEREGWETYIDEELIKNNITDASTSQKIKDAIINGKASFKTDPYGIYGKITHKYKWEEIDLIAGAHYDIEGNRISAGDLTCSLQRLSNNYPFGYIYDDYGHIGIVGARIVSSYIQGTKNDKEKVKKFHLGLNQLLDSGHCMNEIFGFDGENLKLTIKEMDNGGFDIPGRSDDNDIWKNIKSLSSFLTAGKGTARTTVFSLGIKGIVGLTDEVRDSQKEYFENNQLQSTLMLRTETSISNIINAVNKNAEKICRGKWTNGVTWSDDIICYDGSTYLSATPKEMAGKTIVVRGQDMVIDMRNSNNYQSNDKSINLFIDKGNMLLLVDNDDEAFPGQLKCFDDFGYLVTPENCADIRAMFLKGNFIVNGLILGGLDGNETINSRLYMHGKVVSYNTITTPTANRKATIRAILGLSDAADLPEGVSLTKLFTWSCNAVSGEGSDGTSCKGTSAIDSESQLVDKAFGLIDMDIKGDLVNY